MQNFSQILIEARKSKQNDSDVLLASEVTEYINKVKRQLPKNIQDLIYLTVKYNLLDEQTIVQIHAASKGELDTISKELNIDLKVLQDLQSQLQSLKTNIRLLPQMQTKEEREAIMSGRIVASDLTLDLTTDRGRNAAAKMYTPLVYKVVSQYVGKSALDKGALISAGMLGLAEALRDFDPSKTDKPFKTYASYRIQQAILNDINEYSHDLSGTNWYAAKVHGDKLDAVSIDNLVGKDDEDYENDHLSFLGASDDMRWIDIPKSEQEYWEDLWKLLESKFTVKECNIFYRFFGLKDFWGKKEKSKDIAKSYGMSEGNIRNSIINKMLRFLLNDPKSRKILDPLRAIYEQALMRELIYFTDKQAIYEALINDDMFILLEELNRWGNAKSFKTAVSNALDSLSTDDALYIIKCLDKGFEFIDDTYKKHKLVIISFLKIMYPTEIFNRLSDVSIIDYMNEISEYSKEYKIKW